MTEVRRADQEELSESLLALFSESDTFEEALADLVRVVCGSTSWDCGEAWVPEDDRLVRRASYARPEVAAFTADTTDAIDTRDEGFVARTWKRGDPEWLPDLTSSAGQRFPRREDAVDAGLRSALAVPLFANGEVLAVVAFFASVRRDPDEQLMDLLASMSTHLAALLVRDRLEGRIVEESRLLEAVLEAAPVGIFVLDRDRSLVQFNDEAESLLGLSREEAERRGYDSIDWEVRDEVGAPVPPEDRPVNRVFRTGEPVYDERLSYRVPGRGRVLYSVNAAPITNAAGEVETVVVAFLDVGERKEYEEELERKNRELESFASVLSHDLRNPLNVATGYLELLRETGKMEYLDPVERAHQRMDQLIDDLLLLARRGQAIGVRSTVTLGTVVDEAWRGIDAPEADLVVADDLGTIYADESRTVQLFENLFRNAVTHAGPAVTVRVEQLDEPGFAVEDDGPGIPPERRESVLELATDPDRGVRLGLSIVQAIVEAHGWTLTITDARASPTGARFEVRFEDGSIASDGD